MKPLILHKHLILNKIMCFLGTESHNYLICRLLGHWHFSRSPNMPVKTNGKQFLYLVAPFRSVVDVTFMLLEGFKYYTALC